MQLALWKARRVVTIQAIARQFLARKKVKRIHHEHLEVVKLQKVRNENDPINRSMWSRQRM
jgi:hypothetical protein